MSRLEATVRRVDAPATVLFLREVAGPRGVNGRERPTAPSQRDVSVGDPSASAAPASLAVMRMGFTRVRRVEHCACGTDVIQETGASAYSTVRDHNRTPAHWEWRVRRALEFRGP